MRFRKKLFQILIVIMICSIIFIIMSHIVYNRSSMATIVEMYLRNNGCKTVLSDNNKFSKFIEKTKDEKFKLPFYNFNSDIDNIQIDENIIYKLNSNENYDKTILYIHGGGYVTQPVIYHWIFLDKLAKKENAKIYVPIYTLAPNKNWKNAYELLIELYEQILEETNKSIIIMGDSAGGGLALAFTEYLKEKNIEEPNKLVLISPWLDVSMSNANYEYYEEIDPMLVKRGLIECGKLWANGLDLKDYKLSPIYGDLRNIPETLLIVGTREIFYPDIILLKQKLEENSVETKIIIGEDMNHCYPLYPIPEADEVLEKIIDFI